MNKYSSLQQLKENNQSLSKTHLRDLLSDSKRNENLCFQAENIVLDLSHEKINEETINQLQKLADESNVFQKIESMFQGEKINGTEKRAVLHTALRAPKGLELTVDGQNVNKDVHDVLDSIKQFSQKVRDGNFKGYTGKQLKNLVVVGIGGSFLGIEFVQQALHKAVNSHQGRTIQYLANVDPTNFQRIVDSINHEETLVLICSKTFTTKETMLNSRTIRNWFVESYNTQQGKSLSSEEVNTMVSKHFCAVSTNSSLVSAFGIELNNMFGFWDWVGGRYSVCSAIGMLPLSIHYGFDIMEQFLAGAHNIDVLFRNEKDIRKNLPLMIGLLGFLHTEVQEHGSRAIIPYCDALGKFTSHFQQVDMESNGKSVTMTGQELNYKTGPIDFGEPGTNSQHSFFQLLHQGKTIIPVEFIGYIKNQCHVHMEGEAISNHDELMSNFFSQPDALAVGKTIEELKAQNVPAELLMHKRFEGNRPSFSLLFEQLTPYTLGQLLSLYESRVVTEGFLWDINSFDQYGVELGKVLATKVSDFFTKNKSNEQNFEGSSFNSATQNLLKIYQSKKI